MNASTDDTDTVLDPAEALALIDRQQEVMGKQLAREIPWILLAWGVAWLVGFGALWWAAGPVRGMPLWVALAVFGALTVAGVILSSVIGARAQRGIRQTSAAVFTGVVYGVSISIALVALVLVGVALVGQGMPVELLLVVYSVGVTLIVGLAYLMGAAIWRGVTMIYIGAWLVLVSVVAAFVGAPHHFLVLALAGGGGFLVSAATLGAAIRKSAS